MFAGAFRAFKLQEPLRRGSQLLQSCLRRCLRLQPCNSICCHIRSPRIQILHGTLEHLKSTGSRSEQPLPTTSVRPSSNSSLLH